jgi:glucosyl-dolichyl phosphate glucuronosyltransferase
MSTEAAPEVSVVVATHSLERWALLERCLAAVVSQDGPPGEVVLVVDHNADMLRRARSAGWPRVRVIENTLSRGASGARNCGALCARGEILAFLDDDVVPEPQWLAQLLAPFHLPSIVGVAGVAVPHWVMDRPRWFPDEFLWVVGATPPADLRSIPIRNGWGENMAVRSEAFRAVGGFREGFGKMGSRSRPEDTDFCIRVAHTTGGHWVRQPSASVRHHVPAERSSLTFFIRRTWAEGAGKAELVSLESEAELTEESDYVRRVLLRSVPTELRLARQGGWREMITAVERSGAAVLGLAAAAGAYLTHRVSQRSRPRRELTRARKG